eukprot:1136626-Pelagomonas_calceolata.AAC.2
MQGVHAATHNTPLLSTASTAYSAWQHCMPPCLHVFALLGWDALMEQHLGLYMWGACIIEHAWRMHACAHLSACGACGAERRAAGCHDCSSSAGWPSSAGSACVVQRGASREVPAAHPHPSTWTPGHGGGSSQSHLPSLMQHTKLHAVTAQPRGLQSPAVVVVLLLLLQQLFLLGLLEDDWG